MIKCEVIKEFTLEKFDELKNIKRINVDTYGKLYVRDTFECTKEMADYLMGENKDKEVVVKTIEIEPEITIDEEKIIKKVFEENKPTNKKKKKISKK